METAAMAELPVEWAVVEVFGHRSHAGMIREVERFGTKMLRIDVPGEGDAVFATHFYGGAAIFSIRHCTEEYARKQAEWERPRPAVRATLPAPSGEEEDDLVFCEACNGRFEIEEAHSLEDGGWMCTSCLGKQQEEIRSCEHEFEPYILAELSDSRRCKKCGADKQTLIEAGWIAPAVEPAPAPPELAPPPSDGPDEILF